MDNEPKAKRPWRPWQYIVLIFLAILFAMFVLRPIGQQISGVFQQLTNAFQTGK